MFAAVESALIARLQERVTEARSVLSVDDLDGVRESSQPDSALHVMPNRYSVAEQSSGRALVREFWLVWCVTRCVAGPSRGRTAATRRAKASTMTLSVVGALLGWRPFAGASPMALADSPEAFTANGYRYTPLAFSTDILYSETER